VEAGEATARVDEVSVPAEKVLKKMNTRRPGVRLDEKINEQIKNT
jgi:hypothetical protein